MKNIVWCIDPNNQRVDKAQCLKTLHAFTAGQGNASITPLYVLSPKSTQMSRFSQSSLLEKLIPWGQKQLDNYLSDIKSELNFQKSKVIFNQRHSLKQDVLKAIEYAQQINADTIFCSTHQRKSWTLGSFAETLVLKSRIPILLVQPETIKFEYFDNVLFPTDFSSTSKEALKNLIPLAKNWGAQIHIVHQMLSPVDPIIESGVLTMGGGWSSPEAYSLELKNYSNTEIQNMKELCLAQNIECYTNLIESSSYFTEQIVEFANKNNIQLIAMSSSADDYLSVIVGSHCRDLIRNTKTPMWIQHIESN